LRLLKLRWVVLSTGGGGDADPSSGDDDAEKGQGGELRGGGIFFRSEQTFDAHGEYSSIGSESDCGQGRAMLFKERERTGVGEGVAGELDGEVVAAVLFATEHPDKREILAPKQKGAYDMQRLVLMFRESAQVSMRVKLLVAVIWGIVWNVSPPPQLGQRFPLYSQ
jgi:hypothetical protein